MRNDDNKSKLQSETACNQCGESVVPPELGLCRFCDDETIAELYSALASVLTRIAEWSYEYNTTHEDAGRNYLDGCLADGIAYNGADNRLKEYYTENQSDRYGSHVFLSDIPAEQIPDSLWSDTVTRIFEQDRINLETGYAISSPSGYYLDSWCIGEVEEQIELSTLIEKMEKELTEDNPELTIPMVQWLLVNYADNSREHCLHYWYYPERDNQQWDTCCVYVDASYDTWVAAVSDETIRETLTECIVSHCETTDRNRLRNIGKKRFIDSFHQRFDPVSI